MLCSQQQLGLLFSLHSCLRFKGRHQETLVMKLTDHKIQDRISEELKVSLFKLPVFSWMIDTLRKGRKICGVQMRMFKTQQKEMGSWLQVSSLYCRKMIASNKNWAKLNKTDETRKKIQTLWRIQNKERNIGQKLKVFGVFQKFWDVYEKTDTRRDLC